MNRYSKPEFARLEFSKADRERQFAAVVAEWDVSQHLLYDREAYELESRRQREDAIKWQRFEKTFQRNNQFARQMRAEQIERQRQQALNAKMPVDLIQTADDHQKVYEFLQEKDHRERLEKKVRRQAWEESEATRIARTVIPLPREILQTVEMRENERGAYLPFRVCDKPFHLMNPLPKFPYRPKKMHVGGKP